jgi:glycosyltransferase involved in cell wall biosynthesis
MEGIPVSIMEALASGLPVIASDISGISELVRPDETGYLVPPEDPKALADGLEFIYRNPTLALQRARQGQALIRKEFELSRSARKLAHAIGQSL